jgi:hypothetical protein
MPIRFDKVWSENESCLQGSKEQWELLDKRMSQWLIMAEKLIAGCAVKSTLWSDSWPIDTPNCYHVFSRFKLGNFKQCSKNFQTSACKSLISLIIHWKNFYNIWDLRYLITSNLNTELLENCLVINHSKNQGVLSMYCVLSRGCILNLHTK